MGEHAIPHYALRLRRVIEGEQHGICKAANWTSGSDFQLYRLGDAMFNNAGRIKSGFGERKIGGQGFLITINPPPVASVPIHSEKPYIYEAFSYTLFR